jgi:hypothetical protein
MKRLSILVVLTAFLVSGCGGPAHPATSVSPHLTPASTGPPPADPPSTTADPDAAGADPVAAADDGPSGLLAAIRTQHFADHDRVVFQFHGRRAPDPVARYADAITADPSDRPVPLLGRAFVHLAFHGGRLSTAPVESDPQKVRRYPGPTRLTPRYALLQELAVAGDFEAVLSFGLGLSAVSGLSVSTPANSASVDLDIWRTAPDALLWPVTSLAQAREVQTAAENGHQPWVLSAPDVVSSYVDHVLGWPQPTVRRLSDRVFQATAGSRSAVITVRQPLSRPDTVWAVACVVRSAA